MPTATRIVATLLLLLGLAGAAAAQPRTPAPDAAGPIRLAELMALMASVPERRAAFTEEKRFAALDSPLRSSGHLLYRRPGHLEKITEAPQAERMVVDGDRVSLKVGDGEQHVADLGARPELRALVDAVRGPLAGDATTLERAFKVSVAGTRGAWRIDLSPIDPRVIGMLKEVRVSGTGSDMREVLLIQANGDTAYMSIEPAS
jgi:hypothetical protein